MNEPMKKCEQKKSNRKDAAPSDLSRRGFVSLSVAAGLGAVSPAVSGGESPLIDTDVDVKTPDGTCDAYFIHPATGSYPGVLIWHDSPGLRPVMRELGRRIAKEGYSVLVPNLFYRTARAPLFEETFDYSKPADREKYARAAGPFLAAGAAERDAVAYVSFLDSRPEVNIKKRIGTHGYCLGGAYVLKTAAALPERIGAGASFHGGFLVTDKPNSPHLLAPRIKAPLYIAIASDDDKREPQVKEKLKQAFARAKSRVEIEVYPTALHGWCVPDSKAGENKHDADRAWGKLMALYKRAL